MFSINTYESGRLADVNYDTCCAENSGLFVFCLFFFYNGPF